jgi:GT2 family glycosyltransferase
MQFDWEGTTPAHTATRLSKSPSNGDSSMELVPGLYSYQTNVRENTQAFMASAACMMVRRSAFELLGGFDRRLPLGYEDTELCWRASVRGWKVVYVPQAICWHRVGASGKSKEGSRFNFRGIVRGRLLLSTKLLPARYTFLTWIASTAALGKDLAGAHFRRAADRLSVLWQTAQLVPQLLRERRELFAQANTSPREHLGRLLRLPR